VTESSNAAEERGYATEDDEAADHTSLVDLRLRLSWRGDG